MPLPDLIMRFGIALLIGVLIGLEREFARLREETKTFAGVRTFSLIALLGCAAALLVDLTGGWAFCRDARDQRRSRAHLCVALTGQVHKRHAAQKPGW
jgi:uncharacterized membrane protein YhiD involved in acid resistance